MHPSTLALLRFFEFEHLTDPQMRAVSKRYHDLAHEVAELHATSGAEQTVALRKLLESKDCAVRAVLPER